MSGTHQNEINIGQDEWIPYVDIDGQQANATNLDKFIAPMESFLTRLETICMAECCGIDAFRFWPEDIRRATAGSDIQSLAQDLAALREFVEKSKADVFISTWLNQYFHRTEILQLLDHIVRNICS